jgi:hypothetical protein
MTYLVAVLVSVQYRIQRDLSGSFNLVTVMMKASGKGQNENISF